jgi:hypothetical protein
MRGGRDWDRYSRLRARRGPRPGSSAGLARRAPGLLRRLQPRQRPRVLGAGRRRSRGRGDRAIGSRGREASPPWRPGRIGRVDLPCPPETRLASRTFRPDPDRCGCLVVAPRSRDFAVTQLVAHKWVQSQRSRSFASLERVRRPGADDDPQPAAPTHTAPSRLGPPRLSLALLPRGQPPPHPRARSGRWLGSGWGRARGSRGSTARRARRWPAPPRAAPR